MLPVKSVHFISNISCLRPVHIHLNPSILLSIRQPINQSIGQWTWLKIKQIYLFSMQNYHFINPITICIKPCWLSVAMLVFGTQSSSAPLGLEERQTGKLDISIRRRQLDNRASLLLLSPSSFSSYSKIQRSVFMRLQRVGCTLPLLV